MPPPASYSASNFQADREDSAASHNRLTSNTAGRMATLMQPPTLNTFPPQYSPDNRPRLPPIQSIEPPSHTLPRSPLETFPPSASSLPSLRSQYSATSNYSPTTAFSGDRPTGPPSPSALRYSESNTSSRQSRQFADNRYAADAAAEIPTAPPSSQPVSSYRSYSDNPLKRSYGSISNDVERQGIPAPPSLVSPTWSDPRASPYHVPPLRFPGSAENSTSMPSTPSRTQSMTSTMGRVSVSAVPEPMIIPPQSNRLKLHIRQQPRAARAGPDGKDRRAIDPPPVLQLLIDDFDPDSKADMAELKSSFFVVHCRLISAVAPERDVSTLLCVDDDGSVEVQRLLLGTTVSSPFFCQDDPDPEFMPSHPVTITPRPPSPTSRFILSRRKDDKTKGDSKSSKSAAEFGNKTTSPGSFFIFADLSVRKAGEYRLEFGLMKVEPEEMVAGGNLPIISSVTSQPFRVVNAKDFDQVQPSTNLVKGLLDRGAGFPLKLKKGTREGQRGKRIAGQEGDDDDDDEEDDDNELMIMDEDR